MGNEVDAIWERVASILENYFIVGRPIAEDVAKHIHDIISEAGYICVGKGVIPPWDNAPSEVCPQCQGIGEIWRRRADNSGVWETCPTCGGKR